MKKIFACHMRFSFKAIAATVVLSFGLNPLSAQVTETYISGSTWVVPNGVSSITVESWGGGGGGGAARISCVSCQQSAAGGGGKGGMYTRTESIAVTAGQSLTIAVGSGGAAGNQSAGGAGGESSVTINSSKVAWAPGGNGGGYSNSTVGNGATGYSSSAPASGPGVIIYQGGNGATGAKTTTRQSGGGGGGGGGNAGDGTSAVNPVNGAGTPDGISAGGSGGNADGGNGGSGGSGATGSTAGNAGAVRGGGGGAGRIYTASSPTNVNIGGGAGGRGEIRITYTVNLCTANAGAALAYICENGTSVALGGTVGGLATEGIWDDGGVGGTFTPAATDLNATWTAPAAYTGTATLTLTTTNGTCAAVGTDSKTITVATLPGTPVFNAGAASICEGGTSTYSASSAGTGVSVSYSILSGGASIDANTGLVSSVTGDFTVRATATNNCGTEHTDFNVTVNQNPSVPTITASGALTFCSGGSVILSSSEATGNVWSSSEATQDITVTGSGDYSLVYTDANGCSANSAIIHVTVNSNNVIPVITASGAATFCDGGTVILSSSTNSGNEWSSLETTQDITVTETGVFTVTHTDANGCLATSVPFNVTVNPNPAVPTITAAGPTTFCQGGNVSLSSSAASGNLWSTSETTNSIVVSGDATITVTVTDGNGCTATSAPVTVTEGSTPPTTPVITASGAITFCEGGSVVLTSSETSGNLWSTGATTNTITVNTSETVTLTNSGACVTGTSNQVVVIVTPNPAVPTITASGSTTFCQGGNVVLTSSATSGNVWSTTASTNSITVSQTGNYTVTHTNANGCSATSVAKAVTVNPTPVAGAALTAAVTITATPAGQTYQWINCATNQSVSGATSAVFTATSNGSYKVIVTNASGCKDTSACIQVSKVGLDDLEQNSGITLYPNPSHGIITLAGDLEQFPDVIVFDASGKEVMRQVQLSGSVIDCTAFQSGMYIFRIQTSSGISLHRMVIE